MIVVVSGLPGSGKSTVTELLAEELGYRRISTGDIRGRIAQEHNMTIDELNALNEPWTHHAVDDESKRIGEEEDNVVFDSWLAWNFIPQSKKVFLKVSSRVAAERVFAHQRPDEEQHDSVGGVQAMLENRLKEWSGQVKKLYGISFLDESNYDLVIDTSTLSIEETVEKIKDFLKK